MSLSFSSVVVPHSASVFFQSSQFHTLIISETDRQNETRITFCFLTGNLVGREIIIKGGVRGNFRETME